MPPRTDSTPHPHLPCHPRESGGPGPQHRRLPWTPAFAGVTAVLSLSILLWIAPAGADPIDVVATPVMPDTGSPPVTTGQLEYLAGFALTSDSQTFGGLSGMSLSADGATLTALADTGTWFRLALRHDATGRLVGVAGGESERLKDE